MAHTDPHAAAAGHATTGHETSDVSLGGAPRFVIVMTVFLAVVFAFIAWLYTHWRDAAVANDAPRPPVAERQGDRLPPLPRLQTTPAVDLKTFREGEAQVLESYAWVDKEQGVVRLPIARAIDLVAERGLPAAAPAPAGATPAGASAAPAVPAATAPAQ
jgi:hypothetical protein